MRNLQQLLPTVTISLTYFTSFIHCNLYFTLGAENSALSLLGFPCFKRKYRVQRFDGFSQNLTKIFLDYQSLKACEPFGYFKIRFLLCLLMGQRLVNILFVRFKIDFLSNQSEYRKSLTISCSLPSAD